MPDVNIVIQTEIDGHPLPSSPFIQLPDGITQVQAFSVLKTVDAVNSFATIPTVDSFTSIAILLLANPDAELIYRFNGQTDAGIVVPAGGLVMVSGALIDSGAGTNVLVNNSASNSPATIYGFVATTA
jgi:hypothetical protein